MPLWKMEQIAPYFEVEGKHTKFNPLGVKLVKDCFTNSEIGTISFVEKGALYNGESVTTPTIIAHTVTSASPVYRQGNPDTNSYEKSAKALYKTYWRNLSCWGKLHRLAYKWSLPTIAFSLISLFVDRMLAYF